MMHAAKNFVNLRTIDSAFHFDIRYATKNNFLGWPVYPSDACYLHRLPAQALSQIQRELKKINLSLQIFDAYRPLSVQQIM